MVTKTTDQAVLRLRLRGEKKHRWFRCPDVSIDQIMSAVERDDNTGICVLCGSEQLGIEPDAKALWCKNDDCRGNGVFGAQELMLRLLEN